MDEADRPNQLAAVRLDVRPRAGGKDLELRQGIWTRLVALLLPEVADKWEQEAEVRKRHAESLKTEMEALKTLQEAATIAEDRARTESAAGGGALGEVAAEAREAQERRIRDLLEALHQRHGFEIHALPPGHAGNGGGVDESDQ